MNRNPEKSMPAYHVIYSKRKTVALVIQDDGSLQVRAPIGCPREQIEQFIRSKQSWIEKNQNLILASAAQKLPELTATEQYFYKKKALALFAKRVSFFAEIMQVSYGSISVRNQKTRWGSCSSTGNLSFNWRLIRAPGFVFDYIVVHELAHRKEMNHSRAFYNVVSDVLPDYREAQNWLKLYGRTL